MELSDDALRSIIAHLAHLRAGYGEVLAEAELIEPNGDYFPDDFTLDPEGIEALLRRMLTYAPLSDDLDVQLGFVEPEADAKAGGGGCGTGACGTGGGNVDLVRGGAVETQDGYGVIVSTADVGDPIVLTSVMARAIGRIVLFEADEEIDPREEAATSELTAVACGFGLLLLSGACVYKKGCGGMRRHQSTHLGVEELAFALALFVRANGGHPRFPRLPGVVRRHLEVTQKEAFDLALDWVDGHPNLLQAFKERPETLEDGVFEIEEKKGLLSRLLSRSAKKPDDEVPEVPVSRRERSEEELRRIAEAKRLVDEALSEP
jgi:hypothetical protein